MTRRAFAFAVSGLLVIPLLLLSAACAFIERSPPPNIPATVAAEASTVAAEAREAVSTITALVTPEAQRTARATPAGAVATPDPSPIPPPSPTPLPPTATPQPVTPTTEPTLPSPHPEERSGTITSSLGSQIGVKVNGFRDNSLRFDQLVQAINEEEILLGVPFPSPNVTMRRVDQGLGGFCGEYEPEYASRSFGDPYVITGSEIRIRLDEECDEAFASIAHEVAHAWFHGSEPADWIDEGLANIMELQVAAPDGEDGPAYPPITFCDSYRNIAELERGAPGRIGGDQPVGFRCNYLLGNGIFGALMEHHGDSEFNIRLVQLARRKESPTYTPHTIADIRRALGSDPTTLEIINTWYSGNPLMRKYLHLDTVDWTFPPTIDGNYLHFSGKTQTPGVVHDFALEDDGHCSQFVLYEGILGDMWVDSVASPLPAGWSHPEDAKVVAINHQVSPQTGEFSVTARIDGSHLAFIRDLTLLVRSRVVAGSEGFCRDSVSYSQIPVVVGAIPVELKKARFYHLDAVEWTFPPTIDGQYLHFAGRTSEPGMVQDFLPGNDIYCSQFVFYRNPLDQELEANLRDPLPSRYSYEEIPRVVVVNHLIDPVTGTFRVTARINDTSLPFVPDLSLLVRSRVTVGPDGFCIESDSYSQVSIRLGAIPEDRKAERHYHQDAIEWIDPPTVSGNTLRFSGRAAPGSVRLTWQANSCGQFHFYYRNESGYHYIGPLNPILPESREWSDPRPGEVTAQRVMPDGTFDAVVRLAPNALQGYPNPLLLVTTAAVANKAINQCGESQVLSAININ